MYQDIGETVIKEKIGTNGMYEEVIEYVKGLFEGNSGGHDFEHTMRVYKNALEIAADHQDADTKVVALAALLHDADDHKLFHTKNYENARKILDKVGIASDTADKICEVISCVSFSSNKDKVPDTIEAEIVQDADRLDAMGAIGIARTFAYGGEHGRKLEDSVQHFYDKLLLLKDRLNTEKAKKMAERRHTFLIKYLEELKSEIQS